MYIHNGVYITKCIKLIGKYALSFAIFSKISVFCVHSQPILIPGIAYALLIPARLIPSSYASQTAGSMQGQFRDGLGSI